MGSIFAFQSALGLEACISGARAVFAFDARHVPPMYPCLSAASIRSSWRFSEFKHGVIHALYCDVPSFRFHTPLLHFTCPSIAFEGQEDRVREARCEIYVQARTGDVCDFTDVEHNAMPVEYHWDIARRLRGRVQAATIPYNHRRRHRRINSNVLVGRHQDVFLSRSEALRGFIRSQDAIHCHCRWAEKSEDVLRVQVGVRTHV